MSKIVSIALGVECKVADADVPGYIVEAMREDIEKTLKAKYPLLNPDVTVDDWSVI